MVQDVRSHWDTGILSSHDVATAVARRLGAETEAVFAYMIERCRSIQFYPACDRLANTGRMTSEPVFRHTWLIRR